LKALQAIPYLKRTEMVAAATGCVAAVWKVFLFLFSLGNQRFSSAASHRATEFVCFVGVAPSTI
jgi:hypothetical protein